MPPALPSFARRDAGRVVFRDGPTPLLLSLDGPRSADGHGVGVYVRLSVRPVDRPADRQSFAEQFLGTRDAASADDVRDHFHGPLAATATEFVASRAAADVIDRPAGLDAVLRQRADAVAFGCGLELVVPWTVTLDSVSLRGDRDRQQARARQLADADHAALLAGRLAAVGPAHRLSADDQAALLPALLAARPPAAALLTAGPHLVVLDPDGTPRTVAAAPEAGPLRSVRGLDDGTIALGGTAGVQLLDATLTPTRFLPGGLASGRGFNAVARSATTGEIVATHGEIGLAAWPVDGPAVVHATPGPARGAVAAGGLVWLAAGGAACVYDGTAVRPVHDGPSTIVALVPLGESVVVVRQDGTLETFDGGSPRPVRTAQAGDGLAAAAALEAGGLRAIVLADDRGTIDAVTPDGRRLARLAHRTGGVRMLAAIGPGVLAVTADRSGVVSFVGDEPPRTTHVLARTGHHVTDLTPFSR